MGERMFAGRPFSQIVIRLGPKRCCQRPRGRIIRLVKTFKHGDLVERLRGVPVYRTRFLPDQHLLHGLGEPPCFAVGSRQIEPDRLKQAVWVKDCCNLSGTP